MSSRGVGLGDVVTVRIDVPRGAFVKERRSGVPLISPLPCPFDYGEITGSRAADGDAIDAIVYGTATRLAGGPLVFTGPIVGRVRFVDAGKDDDKWIVGRPPTDAERRVLATFFTLYAAAKRLTFRRTRFLGVECSAPT